MTSLFVDVQQITAPALLTQSRQRATRHGRTARHGMFGFTYGYCILCERTCRQETE